MGCVSLLIWGSVPIIKGKATRKNMKVGREQGSGKEPSHPTMGATSRGVVRCGPHTNRSGKPGSESEPAREGSSLECCHAIKANATSG